MKVNLDCVQVYVGCESIFLIPRQFNAMLSRQMCNIRIEITSKIEETVDNSVSVDKEVILELYRSSHSNQSVNGVTLHPIGNRRSYTWRRIHHTAGGAAGTISNKVGGSDSTSTPSHNNSATR